MNKSTLVMVLALGGVASLFADDGGALWGWNISAGANAGFGLRTRLQASPKNAMANLPALHPSVGPDRNTAKNEARNALLSGKKVFFNEDKTAFISPDSTWGQTYPGETQNWRFPDSMADYGNESFNSSKQYVETPGGGYQQIGTWSEIAGGADSVRSGVVGGSDSDVAWGASVDLSHLLYISEDGNWGVDVSIGLTWMRSLNCFRSCGVGASRNATIQSGTTDIAVGGAEFLNWGFGPEDDGWGDGTPDGSGGYTTYALDMNKVEGTPREGSTRVYSDSMYLSTRGDYEEWEISFILKPWYDVNDWLCIHGALGMGVTRSSFEYTMEAIYNGNMIYRSSQEFAEWHCYGIAGGGLLVRAWDFDLSCDGLFRWCQQDMEIRNPDINGTIEKPCAVMRCGLSYAF